MHHENLHLSACLSSTSKLLLNVSDMGKGRVKYYGDLLATATRTSANAIASSLWHGLGKSRYQEDPRCLPFVVEGDPSRP